MNFAMTRKVALAIKALPARCAICAQAFVAVDEVCANVGAELVKIDMSELSQAILTRGAHFKHLGIKD